MAPPRSCCEARDLTIRESSDAASLGADSAGATVTWVSLSPRDSTVEYVAQHGIAARVVVPNDKRLKRQFGVRGVPATLVLDPVGRVRYVRGAVLGSAAAVDSVIASARQAWVPDSGG
jgi:hypothetical protein